MRWRPNTALAAIGEHAVTLVDVLSRRRETIADVDTVVIRTHGVADDALYFALQGRVAEVIRVGDAVAVRPATARSSTATWPGRGEFRLTAGCRRIATDYAETTAISVSIRLNPLSRNPRESAVQVARAAHFQLIEREHVPCAGDRRRA